MLSALAMMSLWGMAAADLTTATCNHFWSQPLVQEKLEEDVKLCVQGIVLQQPDLLFDEHDEQCLEVVCTALMLKLVTPDCFNSGACAATCQESECDEGFSKVCDAIQSMGKDAGLWSAQPSSQVILAALPPEMSSSDTKRATPMASNHPRFSISQYVQSHVQSLAAAPVGQVNLSLLLKGGETSGFGLGWCFVVGLFAMLLTSVVLMGRWKSQLQLVNQEPLLG